MTSILRISAGAATATATVGLAALAGCSSLRPSVAQSPVPGLRQPIATRVVVHVVTHDAKLIGTAVGGARVTIREAATGRVLAEGRHDGATGDTRRIMQEPRARGEAIYTAADGARYDASIAIAEPTMVEIAAEGPLGYPDQMARTSKTLWLFPGRDVTGDGIVLELHGYVIDLLAPDTAATLSSSRATTVRARVRMLCSCPTQRGGMWDVSDVVARLVRDGAVIGEARLAYAGEASTYTGELPAVEAGSYTLEILAASPQSVTFGVVRRRVRVR